MAETKKPKAFMEYDTLEDFKKAFIFFNMQQFALDDENTFLDPTTSNVDGTLQGEMFDNCIRLRFIKENNPEFMKQINEEELLEIARKGYEEAKAKREQEKKEATDEGDKGTTND